jgi:hypothetical protein
MLLVLLNRILVNPPAVCFVIHVRAHFGGRGFGGRGGVDRQNWRLMDSLAKLTHGLC